jgi:hypothetical protein
VRFKTVLRGAMWVYRECRLPETRDGQVDRDAMEVQVSNDIGGRDHLETVLHELLHVLLPRASEKRVTQYGKELADTLWEIGYRMPD